jgi:hypothetical protein
MAERNKGQAEMGFGDDTVEEQSNVQALPASRGGFKQPLNDEQRSKLYTLIVTFLQGGLDLEAAVKHIVSEGSPLMALAAESFFLPLMEIRAEPAEGYQKKMDTVIKNAFGRSHVEADENVVLHAMVIAPNLIPLLQTAAQFARHSQAGRREIGETAQIEDLRKKA